MRLFGHPVHPILVTFPITLFCLAPVCDVLAVLGVATTLAEAGRLCLILGLSTAVLALISGFVDFLGLPTSTSVTRIAVWHGVLAFSATSLFGLALMVRGRGSPSSWAIALEVVGVLVIGAAGWFGGHLVFHWGVGVRDGPHRRR